MAAEGRKLPDIRASAAAFSRVLYTDLLTVVVVSVLFTISSLPLVTIGASIIALCEVITAVVTGEGRGGPTTERKRISLFVESFVANLRTGLPYSVILLLVLLVTTSYARLAVSLRSGVFLLGGLLGLYVAAIVPLWLLRAASITVRSPDTPGFWSALREGAYVALERPSYSVLQILTGAILMLVCATFPIAIFLLLPGTLGVLEVVSFEELTGNGAGSIDRAYRGVFE
ncbi:DUF624 domain-containing protein [Haladaptatus sp. NG-SE-30]